MTLACAILTDDGLHAAIRSRGRRCTRDTNDTYGIMGAAARTDAAPEPARQDGLMGTAREGNHRRRMTRMTCA